MVNKKFNLRPFARIEKRGKVNLSRQRISQVYLRAQLFQKLQRKFSLPFQQLAAPSKFLVQK